MRPLRFQMKFAVQYRFAVNRGFFLSCVMGLCLFVSGLCYAQPQEFILDQKASLVTFEVDSTLHTVHGNAGGLNGSVHFDPETNELELPVAFDVPVSLLDTQNRKRDKVMYNMLHGNQYPAVSLKVMRFSCGDHESADHFTCSAEAGLMIAGVSKEIAFNVDLTQSQDSLLAAGRWEILRDDFSIKTPSVFGVIRVDKKIQIKFHTVWHPKV